MTKPGFEAALDPAEASEQTPVFDLSSPLVVRMYPDGVVSGTVTGSDRLPVAQAQLTLYRLSTDETPGRPIPVDAAQTNTRGQFRFGVGGEAVFRSGAVWEGGGGNCFT